MFLNNDMTHVGITVLKNMITNINTKLKKIKNKIVDTYQTNFALGK